jgi:pSer/pThr/pTyr-binding forkhead associated (FHA) protein
MAVVLIITDPKSKMRLEMTAKPLVLGRSAKADLTISDDMISGQHLKITLKKNKELTVTDLGSTNGTYLNGSKIDFTKVYVGDVISLGQTVISIDKSKLDDKENKIFCNDERTSIRFINAPKNISQNLEEEEVTSKNSDIVLNFDEDGSNKPSQAEPTEEEAPTFKPEDLKDIGPSEDYLEEKTTRLEDSAELEEIKKRRLGAVPKKSGPLALDVSNSKKKGKSKPKGKKKSKKKSSPQSLVEKVFSLFKKK